MSSITTQDVEELSRQVGVSDGSGRAIASYWKVKRRVATADNAPLLPYKPLEDVTREAAIHSARQQKVVTRLLQLLSLRRHLERVRNMCYLLVRRERMRRRLLDIKRALVDVQFRILKVERRGKSPTEATSTSTSATSTSALKKNKDRAANEKERAAKEKEKSSKKKIKSLDVKSKTPEKASTTVEKSSHLSPASQNPTSRFNLDQLSVETLALISQNGTL